MYSAITTDAIETLERIDRITAEDPYDQRIVMVIANLRSTAANVISASQRVDDARIRSSAHTIADGFSAAAELCSRLQDRRS